MTEYRKYSIKNNRFKRSLLIGLTVGENDTLQCNDTMEKHCFICDSLDGIEEGALWGRLHLEWQLEEDMVVVIYVLAADDRTIPHSKNILLDELLKDPKKEISEKIHLMTEMGAKKYIHHKDILLYDLKGRYFYFLAEVIGKGKGCITNIFVTNQGDIVNTELEEPCQEYGSFYHRYMSVFSAVYMDFQAEICGVLEGMDADTMPVESLITYAKWLGLDVSGDFLPEEKLRTLVKEAYILNRKKGTKETLLRVCEIMLDEKVKILEQNLLLNDRSEEKCECGPGFAKGRYDITILYQKRISESRKSQLMFLLDQFKPLRCRIHLQCLENAADLDGYVYMDLNADITDTRVIRLDEEAGLDGNAVIL